MSRNDIGNLYHNEGFRYEKKVFKCFVFSQLFGNYSIDQNQIIFQDQFYFYISSQDETFLNEIYQTLNNNNYLMLKNEFVNILDIHIFHLKPFQGEKIVTLKSLSPILIYSTKDNYSTYYKLSDAESNTFILNNIHDKSVAYGYPLKEECFEIINIHYEKKRMVKFKNCVYRAYLSEFEVKTNFETLLFIYNCGLSSKNSCGFGMIEVVNEKSYISI